MVAATSESVSTSASIVVTDRHLVDFSSTTLVSTTIDNDTNSHGNVTNSNTIIPINAAGPTRAGGRGQNNLVHIFLLGLLVCLACLTLGDGLYRCVIWWYAPTPEPEEKFTPEQQKEQWIHFFKLHRVQWVRVICFYVFSVGREIKTSEWVEYKRKNAD
jgi:hypothetical protein